MYGSQVLFDAIQRLAGRQHGSVTRAQLLGLGIPASTIAGWRTRGALFRVHAGVYAVGRPLSTPLEFAAAAVLACGRRAALSHESALALWGLCAVWPDTAHVTAPGRHRHPGITVHGARGLSRADVRTQLGIRATSPARTMLDCAPSLGQRRLQRLLADARRAGHLHPATLDDVLVRFPHHRGRRLILDVRGDGHAPTRSDLEDAFIAFCARYDLPRPEVNAHVAGRERDAYFPAERLIVELDSWDFHRDHGQFEDDRERDAEALTLGLATYRLTWGRLVRAPDREADRLRQVLARRRAGRGT